MDDLGRAVVFSLGPACDTAVKAQATAYCEQVKASPDGWHLCLQRFVTLPADGGGALDKPSADLIRFFCLHVIEDALKYRYQLLTPPQRTALRELLLTWLREQGSTQQLPAYLWNKVAHVLVLVFKKQYPSEWRSFFVDVLALMPAGMAMVDLVLRVCTAIHEEIVQRDINRTTEDAKLGTEIKDAMRAHDVFLLVDGWYKILTQYHQDNPAIINSCLTVIGLFVSWIDVNLVVNDRFIPLLFGYLEVPELREEACRCIVEIVNKGMDPKDKVALIDTLSLLDCIPSLTAAANEDEEFLDELSGMVSTVGCILITNLYKLETDPQLAAAHRKALELLEKCVPLMRWFLDHEIDDISSKMANFATQYIGFCKHLASSPGGLPVSQQQHMKDILQIITRKLRFDESYNHEREGEDEAFFLDFRKSLLTMFNNMAAIDSAALLQHTQSALRQLRTTLTQNPQSLNYADVEVVLLLVYTLLEAVPHAELWATSPPSPIWAMMSELITSNIVAECPHKAVILLYYGCVTRYKQFFVQQPQYIPQVLAVFFSESGLRSSHPTIRARACYYFNQFCTQVKPQLKNYLEELLSQLTPLLAVTPGMPTPLPTDDQIWLYESAASLVLAETTPPAHQLQMLEAILSPILGRSEEILTNQLYMRDTEDNTMYTTYLAYSIEIVTRMGRSVTSRSECAPYFVQAFRMLVRVIGIPINQDLLRKEMIKFCHRLVASVGAMILPEIPPALALLLQTGDEQTIMDSVVLITQLMSTFKAQLKAYLDEMFMAILHAIFSIFGAPYDVDDQEHARKMVELKRIYFRLLLTMTHSQLVDVFVSETNLPHLPQILQTAVEVAKDPVDAVSQKMALQLLHSLINKWMGSGPNGTPTLAAGVTFMQFTTEHIVPASFEAVLRPEFNMEDAQSGLQVVNEIASLHSDILSKGGPDYLQYLSTVCLPRFMVPQDAALEFVQQLQANNAGAFKKYFRRFVIALRQSMQNAARVPSF